MLQETRCLGVHPVLVVLCITLALAFTLWCLPEERAAPVQTASSGAALLAVPEYFIPRHCMQCNWSLSSGNFKAVT